MKEWKSYGCWEWRNNRGRWCNECRKRRLSDSENEMRLTKKRNRELIPETRWNLSKGTISTSPKDKTVIRSVRRYMTRVRTYSLLHDLAYRTIIPHETLFSWNTVPLATTHEECACVGTVVLASHTRSSLMGPHLQWGAPPTSPATTTYIPLSSVPDESRSLATSYEQIRQWLSDQTSEPAWIHYWNRPPGCFRHTWLQIVESHLAPLDWQRLIVELGTDAQARSTLVPGTAKSDGQATRWWWWWWWWLSPTPFNGH